LTEFFTVPGDLVDPAECSYWRTRELISAVTRENFFDLVECRRSGDREILVLDVGIEVSQKKAHDVLPKERIIIAIPPVDDSDLIIWALRKDFPRVPHTNVGPLDSPRRLCLSDEPYTERRLHWTGPGFLREVSQWFLKTADGTLHEQDQALEPFLPTGLSQVFLPHELSESSIFRFIELRRFIDSIDDIWNARINGEKVKQNCLFIPVECEPQVHGIIESIPQTLSELGQLLKTVQIDLLTMLSDQFAELRGKHKAQNPVWMMKVLILVKIPRKRDSSSGIEKTERYAFLLLRTAKDIEKDIASKRDVGTPAIPASGGPSIPVRVFDTILPLTQEMAAKYNGLETVDTRQMVLIGFGALGSQVYNNFIRMGFGQWTVIDKDWFLPHNTARHTLTRQVIGFPKAMGASFHSSLIVESLITEPLKVDILNPGSQRDDLNSKLVKAAVIIDSSASVAVARHIARDIDSPARRISVFFNPKGTDGVIIAESQDRSLRLDWLEMQYYRAIIERDLLKDHLTENDRRVRYARSCGDISSSIPQDLVSLHAAMCTRGIRNVLDSRAPCITIWIVDPDSLQVTTVPIDMNRAREERVNGWTICTDDRVIEKASQDRRHHLPNETGGVIIGSYDLQRKIIYAVDIVSSPEDSEHWPYLYIRGTQGLKEYVESIQQRTADNLTYVGEWHSHPSDSVQASSTDQKALNALQDDMSKDGLPACMLIIGKGGNYSWNLKYGD